MTDLDLPGRALAIDEAARAVDGVVRVYPADPAVVRSARQLVGSGPVPLSTVADDGSAVVCVGVRADAPAREVAAEVAEAVRAALEPGALVRVRVTRLTA